MHKVPWPLLGLGGRLCIDFLSLHPADLDARTNSQRQVVRGDPFHPVQRLFAKSPSLTSCSTRASATDSYSHLKATNGSTREARRAGMRQARTPSVLAARLQQGSVVLLSCFLEPEMTSLRRIADYSSKRVWKPSTVFRLINFDQTDGRDCRCISRRFHGQN
jgi:hypothetical protein